MEANKEAAFEFIQRGKMALKDGDMDGCLRLFRKSQALYPTREIADLIATMEKQKNKNSQSSQAQTTKKPAQHPPAPTPASTIPDRAFTPEQVSMVKDINKTKNLYELLGVPKDSDSQAITSAYRKLAVKLHPDKNSAPGADDAFKKVKQAYEVLNDDERRKRYDQFGDEEEPQQQSQGHRYYAPQGGEFSPEDIFNAFFFNAQPGRRGQHRNPFFTNFNRASGRSQSEPVVQNQFSTFSFLIPIMLIILMSFLSSPSNEDPYSISRTSTYSVIRQTKSSFTYFVSPSFQNNYGRDPRAVNQVEAMVESQYLKRAESECEKEKIESKRLNAEARKLRGAAQVEKMKMAEQLPNCDLVKRFYNS